MTTTGDSREPIGTLTEEAANLAILSGGLSHEASTVSALRERIGRIETRNGTLLALQGLEPSVSAALADVLVPLAVSHKYALRVRQLLGRMSHHQAARIVPPLVAIVLDNPTQADDDAFRRLAELLEYLGLGAALDDLLKRAARSDDPNIREVAHDLGFGL